MTCLCRLEFAKSARNGHRTRGETQYAFDMPPLNIIAMDTVVGLSSSKNQLHLSLVFDKEGGPLHSLAFPKPAAEADSDKAHTDLRIVTGKNATTRSAGADGSLSPRPTQADSDGSESAKGAMCHD